MTSESGGEALNGAALGLIEDAIRDALRAKRSVQEGSLEVLTRMFR